MIGNTILQAGVGMLVGTGIELAMKGISAWIHRDENRINKGNEASDNIIEQTKAYNEQRTTLKALAGEYTKLANGIRVSGNEIKNISLSDTEYESFLNTCNEIANVAPSLVQSYDSQGNAILNLGKNTDSINKKIEDYITLQRDLTHISTKESIRDQYKGIVTEADNLEEDLASLEKKYTSAKKNYENLKEFYISLNDNKVQTKDLTVSAVEAGNILNQFKEYGYALKDDIIETGEHVITFQVDDIPTEGRELLGKKIEETINEASINASTLQAEYQAQKLLIDSNWKELVPTLQSYIDSSNLFDSLEDTHAELVKSNLKTMISNIDYSTIADEVKAAGTIDKWIDQQLVAPMIVGSKEVKEAWTGLFELEGSRAEMSISKFAEERDKFLEVIAQSQGVDKSEMAARLGYATRNEDGSYNWIIRDEIDRAAARTGIARSGEGSIGEYLNSLTQEDYDIAIDLILDGEKAFASIVEIENALKDAKNSAKELEEQETHSLSAMQDMINTSKSALSSYSSIMSESQSEGGISIESIDLLKSQFSSLIEEVESLEGYDLNALFYNTADGVKLNADEMERLVDIQHELEVSKLAKAIELQKKSINDLDSSSESYTETLTGMQDKLSELYQAQAQNMALYNQQKELFSDYYKIKIAEQTPNAGDNYVDMLSKFKTATEAYNKGLIGTDDFKTVAAYLSPTGSDDPTNFAENYAKATRYLTEDDSGVKNFLKDLDAKGLAEFNEETKRWTYNIKDMYEASQQMGMGKQFMLDMFGRLEDYGFSNNFVESIDDGVQKISSLYDELAREEAKLAEMESLGYDETNKTAIDAQREKVQGLRTDIEETKTAMEQLVAHSADDYNRQVESAKTAIETLSAERQKILESNAYGDNTASIVAMMDEQIRQWGASYQIDVTPYLVDSEAETYASNLKSKITEALNSGMTSSDILNSDTFIEYANLIASLSETEQIDLVGESNINNAVAILERFIDLVKEDLPIEKPIVSEPENETDGIDLIPVSAGDKTEETQKALDEIRNTAEEVNEESYTVKVDSETYDSQKQLEVVKSETVSLEEPVTVPVEADVQQALATVNSMHERLAELQNSGATPSIIIQDEKLKEYAEIIASFPKEIQTEIGIYEANVGSASGILEQLEAVPESITCPVEFTNTEGIATDTITGVVNYTLGTQEEPEAKVAKLMYEKAGQEHPEPETADLVYQPVYDKVTASTPPEKRPSAVYEPDYTKVTNSIPPEKRSTVTYSPVTDEVINWVAPEKGAYVNYYVNSTYINTWTPPRKTGYIDYKVGSISSGSFATGTMLSPAHASGTAYNVINTTPISSAFSSGKVSLPNNELALVNELGQESIIRDGIWSLLPGKMHLENLKKGDIILNAEQTADLLQHGKTNSHARAYAFGTLTDNYLSSAYSSGLGGGIFQGGLSGNKLGASTNKNSSSPNTTKYQQQAANSVAKAAESVEDLVDWIEVLLTRLQSKTDGLIQKAETAIKLSTSLNNYQKAIENISEQIAANEAGAVRYQKQADAIGLSADLKTKVNNGTIDISEYNEDTREKIDEYKQWHEKNLECLQNIADLQEQQIELAQTKLDTIIDKYDLRISQQDAYLDRYDAQLSYRETAGYSDTATKQKDLYTAAIKQENDKVAYFQKAATALFNEMQSQLSSGLMTEGDDRWREVQNQLQEYNISLYESKTAIEEWNQSLRDMQANKLRDALGRFERYADQLADIVSLRQSRDTNITESVYKKQLTANNNQIYYQDKLLSEYLEEQALYEYGSEKWNEYAEKIADCKSAVLGLLTANEELKDSIVEERWETFTKLQEQVDASITEIDYLRDALNDSVNAAGDLTSDGQANIALIGKAITLENQTIADYTKALQKLEKDLKKGNISQVEYNEKQNAFLSIIRDSASAVSDYREELIDLYKEQIEAKNDVLIDNIDMYQKAYESQKEYFDYGENLKEQTKTLDVLDAQIAALNGVTAASSKARLAQLKAQRQEAQDALDKTKRDHEYELKVTGFDTLKENVQSQLEAVQNELEISSTMQQTVVDLMLMNIETGYADAYSTIQSTISNTGVIMSDMTSEAINGWNNVANAIKLAGQAMSEISSYDPSKVASDIKTSTIVTNQTSKEDSSGNKITTTTAEKNATTASSVKNNAGTKESSTMSVLTKATKLKLNKTSLSLTVGKTGKLTVTSTPENASTSYTWSSSSTKIATVSGGSVTAVKKGSATITVKDTVSGKTATCKVTVKAKASTSSNTTSNPTTSTNSSNNTSSTASSVWKNIATNNEDKGNSKLDRNVSIIDRMKYFGYASDSTARKQLFKNLGGSGNYTGTATQNAWMLEQLKKAGYSSGGIVGYSSVNVGDILQKAMISSGDNGIGFLTAGETVMPMKFTELLPQGLKILEEVAKVKLPDVSASQRPLVVNTELNFNIDQISNDIDLDAFAVKLKKEVSQDIVKEVRRLR